jgi:hypothetical protein
MKFEYKSDTMTFRNADKYPLEKRLNAEGATGWELVHYGSFSPSSSDSRDGVSYHAHVIFKRARKEDQP